LHDVVVLSYLLNAFSVISLRSIEQFAEFYSKKLGFSKAVLQKVLWGEHYYNSKKKLVMKKPVGKYIHPLFVKFIFQNIWHIYQVVMIEK